MVLCACLLFGQMLHVLAQQVPTKTDEVSAQEFLSRQQAEHEIDDLPIHDRYLVKIKPENSNSLTVTPEYAAACMASVEAGIEAVLPEAKSVADQQVQQVLSEVQVAGTDAFDLSVQPAYTVEALTEQMLTVSLSEKVDANTFAASLENSAEVEYVQPDYRLMLSDYDSTAAKTAEQPISYEVQTAPTTLPTEIAVPTAVPAETAQPTEAPTVTAAPTDVPEQTTPAQPTVLPTPTPESEPTVPPVPAPVVAVIDSGIDTGHAALADAILPGYDFVNDTELAYDSSKKQDYYHGTHVAGIIAQNAADAKILPLKVFEGGHAYTSDIIRAIVYAEQNGAAIANMSFGSMDNNQALKEAMQASGMLFVCAAGNNRLDLAQTPIYPACFDLDNIISVTSLNPDLGYSFYSNYSTENVDIAAVGREVNSTWPEGLYGEMSGTSQAAAQVSAGAAVAAGLGISDVKTAVLDCSDKLEHLLPKVAAGRSLNIQNIVNGTISDALQQISCEDDFDVLGYQPTPQESWELFSSTKAVQVEAGGEYTLVLKEDGTVWSWGNNSNGQLGNNSNLDSSVPTRVLGLTNVVHISAGGTHALAIKSDGTVWGWGNNDYYQLGHDVQTDFYMPVQTELTDIKEIACGIAYSLYLTNDGTALSSGYDGYGSVGHGYQYDWEWTSYVLSDVKHVYAHNWGSCALTEDGNVYEWGMTTEGDRVSTPNQTEAVSNVDELYYGNRAFIYKTKFGVYWCYGYNTSGGLGAGQDYIGTPVPFDAIEPGDYEKVFFADESVFVLKTDETVWALGYNEDGLLDDTCTNLSSPTWIGSIRNVTQVCSPSVSYYGKRHIVALTEDGEVWVWGNNEHGQLGDGTTTDRLQPYCLDGDMTEKPLMPGGFETERYTVLDCTDAANIEYSEMTADTTITHDDFYSAKITGTDIRCRIRTLPDDLTPYDNLRFWVYGDAEKPMEFYLRFDSDNPDTEGEDYYGNKYRVDWDGWREVVIPLESLTVTRSPLGWTQISRISIYFSGWDIANPADGALYFGSMYLDREHYRTLLNTNEADQIEKLGLTADTSVKKDTTYSAKWQLSQPDSFVLEVPSNISSYSELRFWVYGNTAAYGPTSFYLRFDSDNLDTDGMDYYGSKFTVDWDGWKEIVIPLAFLEESRSPLGLNKVDRLHIFGSGWDIANPDGATLQFGSIFLSNSFTKLFDCADTIEIASLNFAADTEIHKSETQSAKWSYRTPWEFYLRDIPSDLTPYEAVRFWVYGDAEKPMEFYLRFDSENPDTDGPDYYGTQVRVDWDGWREVVLPFSSLAVNRTPLGWDQIDMMSVFFSGWDMNNPTDGVLYFDNIYLDSGTPDSVTMPLPVVMRQQESAAKNVQVVAGGGFSAVLKEDGTVWMWGRNNYGQLGDGTTVDCDFPRPVPGVSDVTQIQAAGGSMLVLKEDGTVWGWGENGNGQLGDGTTTLRTTPQKVEGLTNVKKLSSTYSHVLALKGDGTLWAWGSNGRGQLGDGTKNSATSPQIVPGLSNIVDIAAGKYTSMALTQEGTVYIWGYNYGEVSEDILLPRAMPELGVITDIACNGMNIAINAEGEAWHWGSMYIGYTPHRDYYYSVKIPTKIEGIDNIESATGHDLDLFLIDSNDDVWAVGSNQYGQLGDGSTIDRTVFQKIAGISDVQSVSCSSGHCLALTKDGMVWAWGNNDYNQIERGLGEVVMTPTKLNNTINHVTGTLAAGKGHSLVIEDGMIYASGKGTDGQLGNDDQYDSASVTQVLAPASITDPFTDIKAVAAGNGFSLALRTDSTLWAWGKDIRYLTEQRYNTIDRPIQIIQGNGWLLSGIISISAKNDHWLALTKDGTVWAWGENGDGQLGIGSTTDKFDRIVNVESAEGISNLHDVVAISAGGSHSLALKADGTVWAWGNNEYGQLGNGQTADALLPVQITGLTDVIEISAGESHSMARKADGTVWTWGRNDYGQLGDNTNNNSLTPVQVRGENGAGYLIGVKEIEAGIRYSMAILDDGTLMAWGDNNFYQLGDGTDESKNAPVKIRKSAEADVLSNVVEVSANKNTTMARTADGTVWIWGTSQYGEFGDGIAEATAALPRYFGLISGDNSQPPVRRTGIEYEQSTSDYTDLTAPVIDTVQVEILNFSKGIYRLTIADGDYTIDSRGTPFFFWSTEEGTFSEETSDYRSVVFAADAGTAGKQVHVTVGIGDGLGQVSYWKISLDGNNEG